MPRVKRPLTADGEAIAEEIRKEYGGMLTVEQVMRLIGVSRNTAKKWLLDVPAVNINGRPKYMVSDLARKIDLCRL